MLFMFFIVLLNVVVIALTYYCLEVSDKKDRVIFIAIGIAIMYILTSIVYWFSSKGIEMKEISETGKNLITFLFVPINGIVVLPIFAKAYSKYKMGKIQSQHLRNRAILLAIILFMILVIECGYFKNVQEKVTQMLEDKNTQRIEDNFVNEVLANSVTSELLNNNIENTNQISNDMQTNQVSSNIINTNVTM